MSKQQSVRGGSRRRIVLRHEATMFDSVANDFTKRWHEKFKRDALETVKKDLGRQTKKIHGKVKKKAVTITMRRQQQAAQAQAVSD